MSLRQPYGERNEILCGASIIIDKLTQSIRYFQIYHHHVNFSSSKIVTLTPNDSYQTRKKNNRQVIWQGALLVIVTLYILVTTGRFKSLLESLMILSLLCSLFPSAFGFSSRLLSFGFAVGGTGDFKHSSAISFLVLQKGKDSRSSRGSWF